jgi:hypothetical protein
MSVPTGGNRLKTWLKNPGLRSKLADSSLPPEMLARRRANARADNHAPGASEPRDPADTNPIYQPGRSLSGSALRDAANATVDVAYGPQTQALANQRGDIEASGKRTGDYATTQYGLANQRAQSLLADAPNADAAAMAAQAQIGQQVAGIVGQQATQTFGRQAADAGIRGPGLGGSDQVTPEVAANLGRVGANLGASLQNTSAVNQSQDSLNRSTLSGYQQAGAEFQGALANSTAKRLYDNEVASRDLEAQKGPARVDALSKLRQEGFDNAAVQAQLQFKYDDLAQSGRVADARNRTTRRGQDINNNNADETADIARSRLAAYKKGLSWSHRDRLASIAARNKAGKGPALTPAQKQALIRQNNTVRGTISTVASLYGSVIHAVKDPNGDPDDKNNKVSVNEAIAGMATKYFHGDHDLAMVAYWMYQRPGKPLGPNAIRILKAHGIGVPAEWKPAPAKNSPSERAPGGT